MSVASSRLKHFIAVVLAAAVVMAASIGTYFYRIEEPPGVVFDEFHFGKFANWYITGEYFFDIHPPLAKLLMALHGRDVGISGTEFDFSYLGQRYPDNYPLKEMRRLPALFGSLLPILAFSITMVTTGGSVTASLFAAAAFVFETMIITESRIIVTDAFLFFFIMLSIYFTVQCISLDPDNDSYTTRYYVMLFASALSLGVAVSIKFTAGGTVIAIGLAHLYHVFTRKKRDYFVSIKDLYTRFLVYTAVGLSVLSAGFYFHFALLVRPGTGDPFMTEGFLTDRERKLNSIISSGNDDGVLNGIGTISFVSKTLKLLETMHAANMGITAEHPYSSKWYTWPLAFGKLISYYVSRTPDGTQSVYCVGNIVVWYLPVLGLLLSLVTTAMGVRRQKKHYFATKEFQQTLFLVFGYIFSLLPYVLISRVSWIYHYAPSLIFGVLLFAKEYRALLRSQGMIYWTTLAFVLLLMTVDYRRVFPFVYAIPTSQAEPKIWKFWTM